MHLENVNDGRALDEVSDAVDEGSRHSSISARRLLTLRRSKQAEGPGRADVDRGVQVRLREGQEPVPQVRGGLRPRQELLPRAARYVGLPAPRFRPARSDLNLGPSRREANRRIQCTGARGVQAHGPRPDG